MRYQKEDIKRCTKCGTPMSDFGKFWICEKDGFKINKKVFIGSKLI